MNTRTQ